MSAKEPTEMDRLVGSHVRQQRIRQGITQEQLAEALGVTIVQLNKYEKGLNRIGAGRLHRIAALLEAPITSFFEPHRPDATAASPDAGLDQAEPDPALFADRETIELALAFRRISSLQVRRALLETARTAAQSRPAAEPANTVRTEMARLQRAWPEPEPAPGPTAPGRAPRSGA